MEKFIVAKHGLYASYELCEYDNGPIFEDSKNVYTWDCRMEFKSKDEAQEYADKFGGEVERLC